ncbi:DNA-binding protein YbiB [Comamonas composti]|uniref:DNA-binding protein YbiB n=1 Tax=Comamonas composti TaxID=408558 RepID=UPI00042A6348|nr:DNA-binding protein YbiB [Comamonas composti]
MGISHYLKDIGRGTKGARPLSREHAADLWRQLLDGRVSELEVGAFCVAMRIKGETAEEMAGFLDATEQSLPAWPGGRLPAVILPSYNGARKLPNLTALLAALLARQGLPVLVHGSASEDLRIDTQAIWRELQWPVLTQPGPLVPGQACWIPTQAFAPGLEKLLQVRRQIGLRNPAHSLVKLLDPLAGGQRDTPASLVVSSYTHPEYAQSMAATLALRQSSGLLLRGTEGEAVADLRRQPAMQVWLNGECGFAQESTPSHGQTTPPLPAGLDAASTAEYIQAMLAGRIPVPDSITRQVSFISVLHQAMDQRPAKALQALAQNLLQISMQDLPQNPEKSHV